MRTGFALLLLASFVSAADTKTFSRTIPLDANGRFSLDTFRGSIRIASWDQPRAEVQARIEPDLSGMFSGSVDDVEIRVTGGGSSVSVRSDYLKHWSLFDAGNSPLVHYTIRVPRGASLSIKDYKSESEISGIDGDVDFETYKGTARIDGLRRAARIGTYKGDVRAIFTAFTSPGRVETYKGTIDLAIPRASKFDLEANLERRATLDSAFPVNVRSSRGGERFRSAVNGGGSELRITSYRGNIRLRAQ